MITLRLLLVGLHVILSGCVYSRSGASIVKEGVLFPIETPEKFRMISTHKSEINYELSVARDADHTIFYVDVKQRAPGNPMEGLLRDHKGITVFLQYEKDSKYKIFSFKAENAKVNYYPAEVNGNTLILWEIGTDIGKNYDGKPPDTSLSNNPFENIDAGYRQKMYEVLSSYESNTVSDKGIFEVRSLQHLKDLVKAWTYIPSEKRAAPMVFVIQ